MRPMPASKWRRSSISKRSLPTSPFQWRIVATRRPCTIRWRWSNWPSWRHSSIGPITLTMPCRWSIDGWPRMRLWWYMRRTFSRISPTFCRLCSKRRLARCEWRLSLSLSWFLRLRCFSLLQHTEQLFDLAGRANVDQLLVQTLQGCVQGRA